MKNVTKHVRQAVAAAALPLAVLAAAPGATAAEQPITIVINQSPWFPGFQAVVEKYVKETGNQVQLDINPFAGSLEKQRTAVRTGTSPFDLLIMNAGFFVEFYKGGFLEPLKAIDAKFALGPGIGDFDQTVCWNAAKSTLDCKTGELMSVPINPNVLLLHYRTDLYKEHNLKVPTTWEQLYANAKVLKSARVYGISQRGQRGAFDVTYDVFPYIWAYGGDILKSNADGTFTVAINSPETLAGMEMYIKLARDVGHPSTAGQTQTNVIQNMATGRAAHINSVPAPALFDDPSQSAVVGLVGYAEPPGTEKYGTATPLGHWLAGVPKNIPDPRKKAALAFLGWFQTDAAQRAYAEAGSLPVSLTVLNSDMANQPKFRWMKALAAALPHSRLPFSITESSQVLAITELRLNQAIGGEMPLRDALNKAAAEIAEVMKAAKYTYQTLPDLK
jgi:multiple sugar transport system substrate-binding protein